VNIVILNWPRSLWEGDYKVVKRSGRDEPMWVVIYMGMEAMLGLSLYIYLYLKVAKMLCFSYYLLCFLFNKIVEQEGRTCSEVARKVAQTMYTNVSKCKNDKIKKKKKRKHTILERIIIDRCEK
jgi:hypothetical protein